MNEEFKTCECCNKKINASQIHILADKIFCSECYENETFECDCCHKRFFLKERCTDGDTQICRRCCNDSYNRCTNCNCLVHSRNTLWDDDYPYCEDCFPDDEYDEDTQFRYISYHDYKPTPIFHKCNGEENIRYYGVELEIDDGGQDDDNAKKILYTANKSYDEDYLYIKSDGSLNHGMELVSHPCSMNFHRKEFLWNDIIQIAKKLHYTSHNAQTCGLHVHIGRAELGETCEKQEEVIGRIMFFFESHWNEMVKFSRRTEYQLSRWASRYGYKDKPKEILDDIKEKGKVKYRCVNIVPENTVEIRIFRGTLKFNTFMATLEMVDSICENAVKLTDEELHNQSWNEFVENISPDYAELIQYLKERQLYINELVTAEEEI